MIKVALTGNIASGKTTLKNFLIGRGYKVFDADKCSHELLENNLDVLRLLGTNDRAELRGSVFNDKSKLKTLEDILHPLIKEELKKFFKLNEQQKIVFAEIPLLFETGLERDFDRVIFLSAPYDLRLKRLIERSGYSEEYARLRLDSQTGEEEKIKNSDFIINNNKDKTSLEKEILEIIKSLELL